MRACVVGSSDGIGAATAEALLDEGWSVIGLSRSASALVHTRYSHFECDVTSAAYREALAHLLNDPLDALIYCVAIGEPFTRHDFGRELRVFEVNLLAAVATAAAVLPAMIARGSGQFVVLSSLADRLISADFPSYNASKAALSSYFDGLGSALRDSGVVVSHVRFGFVATKLAKAKLRPFMVSREVAAQIVLCTLRERRRRVSFPWRMALLVATLSSLQWVKRWFAR
jgi:short-subunit dehydrogenase